MDYRFTTNAFVSIEVKADTEEEARWKMRNSAPEEWEIDRVHDRNAEFLDE